MPDVLTHSAKDTAAVVSVDRADGPGADGLEQLPERIRTIATLRGLGYSFREIARQFDVTPQAASIMLSRYRRSLKRLEGSREMKGLSARAVNALGRRGIRNPEQARRADVLQLLHRERNCGRKTLDEIAQWMLEPRDSHNREQPADGSRPEVG